MTPTVDMLEKEIEQFHKNIQNSNKLLNILAGVSSAINTQTQEFDNKVAELQQIAKALPEEIRSDFAKQIEALCEEVHTENRVQASKIQNLMERYVSQVIAAKDDIIAVPSGMERVVGKLETQFADEIHLAQKSHADLIAGYEAKLLEFQGQIQTLPDSQKALFSQSAEALLQNIQTSNTELHNQIKEEQKHYFSRLDAYLSQLEAYQNQLDTLPGELQQTVDTSAAELVRSIQAINEEHTKTISVIIECFGKQTEGNTSQYIQATKQSAALLEEKQETFLKKMESTNVDQVYRLCQEMNSKMNMKLNIAIALGIVATIVSAVSILLR